MRDSMRRLLREVIDYAGLFPPAKLGMAESLGNYLDYIHGDKKWIVSRFVCPAGRLGELATELSQHPDEPYIPVAVIGHPSSDRSSWHNALEQDARLMTAFQDMAENHAEIQAYEIRIPDHAHLESYCKDLRSFDHVELFAELPWGDEMPDSIALIAECEWLGAKARTGGTDASAYPSASDLAGFIHGCVSVETPFKLTAGLHHPLAHPDASLDVRMHGFLNVLGATALSISEDFSRREIEDVLNDDNPRSWKFEEKGLRWRDHLVRIDEIDHTRELFMSFGSCSVKEPLEGLVSAGILELASK